ncbi:MAG: hypothetical protein HY397_01745 [Candidatus Doudnabacteria bacterium]|nr:hypothetical protein [Candidatus Doudnabacteria bacterium]
MKLKVDKNAWRLMSQRQRMSPFPNYMSMEAMARRLKSYVGVNLEATLLIFEDRLMNAFNPKKNFDEAGSSILRRIIREPKLYKTLIALQHKFGNKLVHFTILAGKRARVQPTNRELYEFFAGYNKYYLEVYATYGSVWVVENVLNVALLKIVQKRIADPVEASKILNVLTLQPSAMVARIEREHLLGVAAEVAKNPGWTREIKNSTLTDEKLVKLIKDHEKEYFWVTRDYEDPVLTFEQILQRLKVVLVSNPVKVHQEMVAERKDIALQQQNLASKLSLTVQEKQLFSSMLDLAHLKELRKRYVSESLYYFDDVLQTIAEHSFLTLKQVRFLRTVDVGEILLKGKDFSAEANDRIKLSAWITDGRESAVYTGAKAAAFKKTLIDFSPDTKEFQGFPVSPGKARGPARIVMNPDEIGKIKKGDIIVTVQVVPSFAPAIHRAAGLICDGGHGVTTHPAILAREAKIPAIIQTRFARQVLHDGDIVEVDGFAGTARIVKRMKP